MNIKTQQEEPASVLDDVAVDIMNVQDHTRLALMHAAQEQAQQKENVDSQAEGHFTGHIALKSTADIKHITWGEPSHGKTTSAANLLGQTEYIYSVWRPGTPEENA